MVLVTLVGHTYDVARGERCAGKAARRVVLTTDATHAPIFIFCFFASVVQAARQWLLRHRPELAARFELASKKRFLRAYYFCLKTYRRAKAMHDRTGDCTSLVPADLYELLRQAFEHAESILSTSILTIPLPSGMEPAAVQSSAPPASSQTQLMGASGTAAALSADAAAGTAVAVRASTLEGRMQSEASSSVQPLCVLCHLRPAVRPAACHCPPHRHT